MPTASQLDCKEATISYVYQKLLPQVMSTEGPRAINVDRSFRDHLIASGAPRLDADELAERWAPAVRVRIESLLKTWDALGVPPPLSSTDRADTFVVWRHPEYANLTGSDPLPPEFPKIYDLLGGLSAKEFLIFCACLLKLSNANPIYVTDGPGDEGVDLIGRLQVGPLRSIVIFLQAKTALDRVSREVILQEFAKYIYLPHTKKYQQMST